MKQFNTYSHKFYKNSIKKLNSCHLKKIFSYFKINKIDIN